MKYFSSFIFATVLVACGQALLMDDYIDVVTKMSRNPEKAACTGQMLMNFQQCSLTYFANFGFNTIPAYSAYTTAKQNYFRTQGVVGFQAFCGWVNTLQTCNGGVANMCLNQQTLQSTGMNANDAHSFTIDWAVDKYECNGTIKSDFVNHWYCIASVENHQVSALRQCGTQLAQSLQNGTPQCTAVPTFISA